MQGLVTLDFGNSNPHAGLFQKIGQEWKLLKVVPWNELSIFLNQLNMTPNNSSLVLCEVKSREEELVPLLQQGFLLTRIKDYWRGTKFAGMPVNYANTLGEDRLIQAYYIYKQFKKRTLILDSGTFLTMDIVDSGGFQGGYILPNLDIYLNCFKKGELLRSINFDRNVSLSLPHNTAEATQNSYSAFVQLAKNLIIEHQLQDVFITGGNADFWEELLKDLKLPIHVHKDSNLIHLAIQYWMQTQIEPL